MALKVNSNSKIAYTLKQIMETKQSEMWIQAKESVKNLTEVQKRIVELLPAYRKQLPASFTDLEDNNAQNALVNHIRLTSLYALSEYIWEKIEKECEDLAKCSGHDASDERNAQDVLQKTLETVAGFLFDSIIEDEVTGLLRINNLKNKFKNNLNFSVYKQWWFCDIIGTIDYHGIKYEDLWKSVIESQDPQSSNLKDLLDDDLMVRVY